MNLLSSILFSAAVISATACGPKNSPKDAAGEAGNPEKALSDSLTICGAYALYPLAEAWGAEFCKLNPEVRITVGAQGTGQGLDGLRSGTCELAMTSRGLTPEELAEGFHQVPVSKDAVVLIINRTNPLTYRLLTRGMDPRMLQKIFTSEKELAWGDVLDTVSHEKIRVFTRADRSGAADLLANFIWKTQADLKGIPVTGDEEMIRHVQDNKYGIGYCNLSYAYDRTTGNRVRDIQVIPLDLDFDAAVDRKEQPYETLDKIHRAIWLGLYPKQLCRSLSFVISKDTRDSLILDFMNWTITHGDSCAKIAGFCTLNDVEKRISYSALEVIR